MIKVNMNTFAQRLNVALSKLGLTQVEAAKKCGIRQQTLSYIIQKNLASSKLAPKIASALAINPEWLIHGRGRFKEVQVIGIPILHSIIMLNSFLRHELDKEEVKYIFTTLSLGDDAFAYLLEPTKLVLCSQGRSDFSEKEYLTINNYKVFVTEKREKQSFPIVEWRGRYVSF